MSCYGDKVTVPLKTLVQHACTKVPDKAEYRNKMAQVRYMCVHVYMVNSVLNSIQHKHMQQSLMNYAIDFK
jgi:hypothetical protein